MTDKELLDLYRKKRAVDGLNGRTWDSQEHLKYDEIIEMEEGCHTCLPGRLPTFPPLKKGEHSGR